MLVLWLSRRRGSVCLARGPGQVKERSPAPRLRTLHLCPKALPSVAICETADINGRARGGGLSARGRRPASASTRPGERPQPQPRRPLRGARRLPRPAAWPAEGPGGPEWRNEGPRGGGWGPGRDVPDPRAKKLNHGWGHHVSMPTKCFGSRCWNGEGFPCRTVGEPEGPARPMGALMAVLFSLGASLVESFPP